MSDFWTEYFDSVSPKPGKIQLRWDTCTVGVYDTIEECIEAAKQNSSFEIDPNDFWYKPFGQKDWLRLNLARSEGGW
jgi:hypothetical protein